MLEFENQNIEFKQEQYKKSLISYPEQTKVDISAHYSLRPI